MSDGQISSIFFQIGGAVVAIEAVRQGIAVLRDRFNLERTKKECEIEFDRVMSESPLPSKPNADEINEAPHV